MQIKKPLLATAFDPDKAVFPYLATPKIDGIRFLMIDGQAVSRSFKPIRNKFIQAQLSASLPDGIDGEITCGVNFQDSTSGVMSFDGEPDFKVWIFDFVAPERDEVCGYTDRMIELSKIDFLKLNFQYEVLEPSLVNSIEEVYQIQHEFISGGHEGVMLRSPNGTYKFGRSSIKENILLKVKEFVDDEGVVVGFKEKMHNENVPTKNALGHQERKGGKDGLVPAGTLGALIVEYKGHQLGVGTGLNDEMRREIWDNQDKYLGQLAKFKFMKHGVKDLPRHPVFLGFRHADDISE